uniref:Uncharacterized protein n=1 Tax=Meloidogyne enterolobii TaxID=390850 RepID=A0A6V7VV44_MELEN|nr:unnamed protein product [Meloidogyne enterolobii]
MTSINSTTQINLTWLAIDLEQSLLSPAYVIVLRTEIVLLFTILLLICELIRQFLKRRIAIHINLLLLFVSIVVLYFIHSATQFATVLRYFVLLLYYKDPHELLAPLWLVSLLVGSFYIQVICYPSLHFCVMLERLRATLFLNKYENEGRKLAIFMITITWATSIGFMAFIILQAYADPSMEILGALYLTTKSTSEILIYVNILTTIMVIMTAFSDWRITIMNRRIQELRARATDYSLSISFQLNENLLSMRLILPMDIAYATIYLLYNALVVLLRSYRYELTAATYVFYYNVLNMLLYLYAAVTLIVYIRFIKFIKNNQQRTNEKTIKLVDQATIHFKELQKQWG